jgi:hypothetical protein
VQRVERRRFLAWTATGAAIMAGGLLARARGSGAVLPDAVARELKVLAPWEYRVVEAVGARIVAPERAEVARTVDDTLAELPPADQRDVRRLLAIVEHGAPLGTGRWRRFTALDAAAQDAVLRSLERSPSASLRGGFGVLKTLAYLALYRDPRSWPALGYAGPVIHFGR